MITRRIISEVEPRLEKCGYELSCVLRNGVKHLVSFTGGHHSSSIVIDTEDCQAAYIRNFNPANTEQEDYIKLTVSCEDYEVSNSDNHHHHRHILTLSFFRMYSEEPYLSMISSELIRTQDYC